MSTVLKIENLSKRYRLGFKESRKDTLAGQLAQTLAAPAKNLKRLRGMTSFKEGDDENVFWALRDINFEVKQGEVLGIIGHNGAGKSTLLKLLSRITEPTTGTIGVKGRIAALLEVGTGFHQDLSGRENIYMNGTILGMTKKEIDRKLDEIVAFSGVEKHLDTAVKFYSSGMKVRLGFSVAAHLDPEILIIDEVLAVGDAEFQKKCLGKMESVAGEGRTVLFVSHDMTNISKLCSRTLVLKGGTIVNDGPSDQMVDYYMNKLIGDLGTERNFEVDPEKPVSIVKASVKPKEGNQLMLQKSILISISLYVSEAVSNVHPVVRVKTDKGILVFNTTDYREHKNPTYHKGTQYLECEIPAHVFNDKKYYLDFLLVQNGRYTLINQENILAFTVMDNGETRGDYIGEWHGVVRPLCTWQIHTNTKTPTIN
jgi:lipopolysaccharide transport system ATP-binding protein